MHPENLRPLDRPVVQNPMSEMLGPKLDREVLGPLESLFVLAQRFHEVKCQ